MIDAKSLSILEYEKVLSRAAEFAHSFPGKKLLLAAQPAQTIEQAALLLEQTAQADRILYDLSVAPSFAFDDMEEAIQCAEKSSALSMAQVLKFGRLLATAHRVKRCVGVLNDERIDLIRKFVSDLYCDPDLEENISSSILGESEMSDNASARLRSIRQNIRNCNDNIRQKLNRYMSTGAHSKMVQDNVVTMRGSRYVIPLKSEYKGQIDGLIHDQSSSGATLFVEPIEIVRLNNELRTLQAEESDEILKILQRFTAEIYEKLSGLRLSYEILCELDAIFAKAAYCHSIDAILPKLNDRGNVDIVLGRHPLIAKERVVPVSVKIGYDYSALVITGPNTGGKTVTLKLIGLLSLMAASGFFVPAQADSEICIFDDIYCDIGDEQSIEQNLSTFSSHVSNLVRITERAHPNCLALLDELGAGTDPAEGSCLAIAVIEYLRSSGCITVTTSHYNELKEYSFTTEGVRNACMDFDPITFAPTYRLLIGLSGSSNALAIAARLGLKQQIVSSAQSMLSEEKISFDRIIAAAERSRREAEDLKRRAREERDLVGAEKRRVEAITAELESKKAKLDEKLARAAKDLLGDYLEEADDLIQQMKELSKRSDERALFEARKLNKKLKDLSDRSHKPQAPSFEKVDGEIRAGDRVFVKSLNGIALVLDFNPKKDEYTVKAGIITTKVKKSAVFKVNANSQPNAREGVSVKKPFTNVACPQEINVIGLTSDEAIYRVDQYLSDAAMQGYRQVRVVHGKGTGVLRRTLQEFFRTHSLVDSYRIGQYGEGEDGVTVVTLK